MSRSSPACRPRSSRAPKRCWTRLEKGEQSGALTRLAEDLPLFSAARRPAASTPAKPSVVEAALAEIHPDELSPREALEALYRLRATLGQA